MFNEKLQEVLDLHKGKEFSLGSNNCIQFTNKCWVAYHGKPWKEEWDKIYHLRSTGYDDPLEAADSVLQRVDEAKEGDLVALKVPSDGYMKGIVSGFCIGQFSVFLSPKGIRYIPSNKVDYVWRNKDVV